MLPLFAVLAMLFTLLDHLTTWLCLRTELPGWEIREGNPLAAWMFAHLGLLQGLALDTAVTLAAVILVAQTRRVPRVVKLALLGLLITTSAFAVANNVQVIRHTGLLDATAARL